MTQKSMFVDLLAERIPLTEFAVTVAALAEAGGVTPGYISRLCRDGRLKAIKLGTVWLIAERSAERWLEHRAGRGRPANGEEAPSWHED